MAQVHFTNAHDFTLRYSDFDDYTAVQVGKRKIVLEYDVELAGRPFDPTRSPFTVEIKIDDGAVVRPSQGAYAGETLLNGGTLRSIVWKGQDGATQVEMADIGMDAGVFHLYLLEQPFRLYDALVAGGSTFVGNDGLTTGVDVKTGWGDDLVQIQPGDGSMIRDFGGADRYIGVAESFDAVSYSGWFSRRPDLDSGIVANLKRGWIDGPDGARDEVSSIERVVGTILDDRFVGSAGDDVFEPLRGADTINGGAGWDTVRYDSEDTSGGGDGIKVNLAKGFVRDGFGTVDVLRKVDGLSTVEAAQGTDRGDIFRDDQQDNAFRGRAGDDVFYLARGTDSVHGDEGGDTFVFRGTAFGRDVIRDFDAAEGDRIEIRAADEFRDLTIIALDNGLLVSVNAASSVFLDGVFEINASAFMF